MRRRELADTATEKERTRPKPGFDGVARGTLTVFFGSSGLLIGFANRLLAEESHT